MPVCYNVEKLPMILFLYSASEHVSGMKMFKEIISAIDLYSFVYYMCMEPMMHRYITLQTNNSTFSVHPLPVNCQRKKKLYAMPHNISKSRSEFINIH